jgi:hypothetical protein
MSKSKRLVELYFHDPARPFGQRFLGAVLMKDEGMDAGALSERAWNLGINPGGEIVIYDIDSDDLTGFTSAYLDRLLSEEECLALDIFQRKAAPDRN